MTAGIALRAGDRARPGGIASIRPSPLRLSLGPFSNWPRGGSGPSPARWVRVAELGPPEPGPLRRRRAGRHLAPPIPTGWRSRRAGAAALASPTAGSPAWRTAIPWPPSPCLVVTDSTGSARQRRIRAAAAIELETIEELFAARIATETTRTWECRLARVRARRVRRLEALNWRDPGRHRWI